MTTNPKKQSWLISTIGPQDLSPARLLNPREDKFSSFPSPLCGGGESGGSFQSAQELIFRILIQDFHVHVFLDQELRTLHELRSPPLYK